ncbi:MAG: hypothetical protein PHI97_31735 [Desulfobulbus sp.]|jgi:hypothetical protein|nr:hypothetical protein [Desulfobulbus sp.]
MSTINSRLREAIKSVVKEIGAMSKQEFRQELNKAIGSDRARSLYHAWNAHCSESLSFKDCCVTWKKVSVDKQGFCGALDVQSGSLFKDGKSFCKKDVSVDYERVVSTSDDYFKFQAAA